MARAEDIFERICKDGEDVINEFILTRKSEELFLDFKRSADNGCGRRLDQRDRNNLAKAISGFGNSQGGVIVWGIDCSKAKDNADVANAKIPIENVNRFVSWLENAVSGCTIPPHVGVQNHPININSAGDGFVATLIPKSIHTPHQVVGTYKYLIRAGSSFVPTPHDVLAGMFGRRPQPHVYHMFVYRPAELIVDKHLTVEIEIELRNDGPGIASDLFVSIRIESTPGDNCARIVKPADSRDWIHRQFFSGRSQSVISHSEVRIPPESFIGALTIGMRLSPPFSRELKIRGICGCNQAPLEHYQEPWYRRWFKRKREMKRG